MQKEEAVYLSCTKVEENLIAENQRLRMEIEYLRNEYLSTCGRAMVRQKALIIFELKE